MPFCDIEVDSQIYKGYQIDIALVDHRWRCRVYGPFYGRSVASVEALDPKEALEKGKAVVENNILSEKVILRSAIELLEKDRKEGAKFLDTLWYDLNS